MDKHEKIARDVVSRVGHIAVYAKWVQVVKTAIRAAVAEAVAEEREACINDICPFCRGVWPDYAPAEQMDTGEWLHPHVDGIDNDWVPCNAVNIHCSARAAASASAEEDKG